MISLWPEASACLYSHVTFLLKFLRHFSFTNSVYAGQWQEIAGEAESSHINPNKMYYKTAIVHIHSKKIMVLMNLLDGTGHGRRAGSKMPSTVNREWPYRGPSHFQAPLSFSLNAGNFFSLTAVAAVVLCVLWFLNGADSEKLPQR